MSKILMKDNPISLFSVDYKTHQDYIVHQWGKDPSCILKKETSPLNKIVLHASSTSSNPKGN